MQTTKKVAAGNKKKLSTGRNQNKGENLFRNLFIDELKDIYWAEKHLTKNLPKMIKAATTDELRSAITNHLDETEEQVKKLERVFELIGEKAVAKKCDAMEGLVEEVSGIIEETEKGTYTRDAGLITAGQKVEHYEIATYGSLVEFANTMGNTDVVAILKEILQEERDADLNLSELAKKNINKMAMKEWDDEKSE